MVFGPDGTPIGYSNQPPFYAVPGAHAGNGSITLDDKPAGKVGATVGINTQISATVTSAPPGSVPFISLNDPNAVARIAAGRFPPPTGKTVLIIDASGTLGPMRTGSSNFRKAAEGVARYMGYNVSKLVGRENATVQNVKTAFAKRPSGLVFYGHSNVGTITLFDPRSEGGTSRVTPEWLASQLNGRPLDFLVSPACSLGCILQDGLSFASSKITKAFYGYNTLASGSPVNMLPNELTLDEYNNIAIWANGTPLIMPGTNLRYVVPFPTSW
jgi:hypothetical protein